MRIFSVLALVLLAGCAAAPVDDEEPAEASGEALTNDVLKSALVAGEIGETPTGYMAIVDPSKASTDLKRNLADNTIKRRAVYTKIAQDFVWTTVQSIAERTACQVYETNIQIGYTYRLDDGTWKKRTATEPVVMPAHCIK